MHDRTATPRPAAITRHRIITGAVIAIFLAIVAVEWVAILRLNDGTFSYTLDDPHIHLALSENIAQGHYGINLSEPSAPASSIVWPLLFIPFAQTAVLPYLPLAFNVPTGTATLFIYGRIVALIVGLPVTRRGALAHVALGVGLLVVTNVVGLVFTGMEHALQLLLSSLLLLGLLRESRTGRAPWWLALAIVAGPLVRYENLALSVPALGYLVARRHPRMVLASGTMLALGLGTFSAFLYRHDLGLLPSSVRVKSHIVQSGSTDAAPLPTLIDTFQRNGSYAAGFAMLLGLVLLLFWLWYRQPDAAERALAVWIASASVVHLFAGAVDGYRYEVSIVATLLLSLLYLYRDWRAWLPDRTRRRGPVAATALLALALLLKAYAPVLVEIPIAANNIYSQQYQMHRFIVDFYQGPVAVTDLGWTAFRNDHHVTDLWGLGSKSALDARLTHDDGQWLNPVVEASGARLAMIYEHRFPGQIPDNWLWVGELRLSDDRPVITPASNTVTFYALDAPTHRTAVALLERFRRTLPASAYIVTTQSTVSPTSQNPLQ